MRSICLLFILTLFHTSIVLGQDKNDTLKFSIVFKFESVCCGVPNDTPLKNYLKSFKKKNNIKILQASYIGPMGREGEYYIGFNLTEMNKQQKTSFYKGLKSTASKMKDKGKAVAEKKFSINKSTLSERITIKEIEF